jgi:GNAT superfamily N-acetyltransferase
MRIRSIDVHDEAGLRGWYGPGRRAHLHDRPSMPFWGEGEAIALVMSDDPEERMLPFVVEVADEVLGAGIVFLPLLDNPTLAYAMLHVDPAHRRRGVGSLLVEHAAALAREADRTTVVVQAQVPHDADDTHPVHLFAKRHGFAAGNVELRRLLELPLPEEALRRWSDEAAAHHTGYEIATYVDDVPDALRQSFVDLQNRLPTDAPTGDIDFEAGGLTVEAYARQVATRVAAGRRSYVTLAVKDGAVVAYTTLSVPPGDDAMPYLNQWGTLVHAAHRGHRLGLAVKAASLRVVQRAHPERTLVSTTNSPENGPMLAINDRMGFRPVEASIEFTRAV